ncbi:pentapeptide repeat-containing protein [Lentzea sp. NPDC051838]|uniref:pentapeptide repeat-containing protein n=1 Tax=Lentzea sp. NPDC051838 TaxID=3154849 RepID=UPI00342E2446
MITTMITAFTAVGALVFTSLALKATQAQNAVTEQGHFTDRYTKAVEQLDKAGTDHLQARLGAIYSLERLARDSPRDQATIVEVLSAFIRTNAAAPTIASRDRSSCPDLPPHPDVHAALAVLSRRDSGRDNRALVDLRGTCLRNARITHLPSGGFGTNVYKAQFAGAYLDGADLSGAELWFVDLRGAHLDGAYLNGTKLGSADLFAAALTDTHLNGANLRDADLRSATLNGADVRGADFSRVQHDEFTDVEGVTTDTKTLGRWW